MKKLPIKWFAVFSLSLLVVSCTGCSTIRKAYWDHKVDEMCEKDGGTVIYEKVEISRKDYPNVKLTSTGKIILPSQEMAKINDPFYYISETEYLRRGSLDVMRHKQSIYRSSDKKLLGKRVSYGRRGGDYLFIEGPFHPSSYSCGDSEKNINEYSSIVTVNGE